MHSHNCQIVTTHISHTTPALQRLPAVSRCRRQICRACTAVKATPPAVAINIRLATTPAELRAAGYLRAYTFYTYPPDRSEYSRRMHRRMKGDAEWESVTRKVTGTEPEYKSMKVLCMVAAVDDDPESPIAAKAAAELDTSTKLPADAATQQPAQLVVGSLDINQGAVLPAEDLVGRLPTVNQALRRAYLSNVCVASAARRQGVAATLMRAAEQQAQQLGVEHLYVHVVADNSPARNLYISLGYELEAEETEAFAHALRRPRRQLLHKQL